MPYKNPQDRKANSKRYHVENRERLNAKTAAYRKENKDDLRAQNVEYRANNKSRLSESRRDYYLKNKDSILSKNKEYVAENKESVAENKRERHARNKARLNAISREYYANHKCAISHTAKAYREKNKELLKIKSQEYYKSKKTEILARNKIYREENPEVVRRFHELRRSRQLKSTINDSADNFYKFVGQNKLFKCYYCKATVKRCDMHVDHIIPLAKGGPHAESNLCTSCATCNQRKNAKLPSEIRFIDQSFLNL